MKYGESHGSTFDSDTVLLTDHPLLVKVAERNFYDFEVPTSLVSASKVAMYYTNVDKANLDIRTSVNQIGSIINTSQELNSRLWDLIANGYSKDSDEVRSLYKDIAQLDILSGLEIDAAKRIIPINNKKELAKLKEKYRQRDARGRKIRPNFFAPIAKAKGYYDTSRINYKRHQTPMDFVQQILNKFQFSLPKDFDDNLPLSTMCEVKVNYNALRKEQIRRILKLVRDTDDQVRQIWGYEQIDAADKRAIVADIRNDCARYIGGLTITDSTAYHLLKAIEHPQNRDVSRLLFAVLFGSPNSAFFRILKKNATGVPMLYEDPDGDIVLYGLTFSKLQFTQ